MARARNTGILFKNSAALEEAEKLTAIVLDKTGTITKGEPAVTQIILSEQARSLVLEGAGGAEINSGDQWLRLAASAEQGSEHPLGEAIVAEAQLRGLALSVPGSFEAIPGHGIVATVDGHDVLVGNKRLMEREEVLLGGLLDEAAELESLGANNYVAVSRWTWPWPLSL